MTTPVDARRKYAWAVILVLAVGLQISADDGSGESPMISNVFFETEIRQALQDLGSQAGVTIIAWYGLTISRGRVMPVMMAMGTKAAALTPSMVSSAGRTRNAARVA